MTPSERISYAIFQFYLQHGRAASIHNVAEESRLSVSEVCHALIHDPPQWIERDGSGYLPTLQSLRDRILEMEDNARERAEAADRDID